MQAVIMAAGIGKRLGILTRQIPKCLLQVGGTTIIERQLDILRRHDIRDITIVVGYCAKIIEERLRERGITFVFNPFYDTTNVLTSFWFAREKLHDDLIFLHGDTIFEIPIFEDMLHAKGDVVLPINFKACKEEDMKVVVNDSQILRITKEMPPQESDGEFIGIAKMRKRVLQDLVEILDDFMAGRELNLFFEAAIQKLIDRDKYLITFTDTNAHFWEEIDFIEDLERARMMFEHEVIS